jgi:hypothetical protein
MENVGIIVGQLEYLTDIWYTLCMALWCILLLFGRFSPVLVCRTKENLATLLKRRMKKVSSSLSRFITHFQSVGCVKGLLCRCRWLLGTPKSCPMKTIAQSSHPAYAQSNHTGNTLEKGRKGKKASCKILARIPVDYVDAVHI